MSGWGSCQYLTIHFFIFDKTRAEDLYLEENLRMNDKNALSLSHTHTHTYTKAPFNMKAIVQVPIDFLKVILEIPQKIYQMELLLVE